MNKIKYLKHCTHFGSTFLKILNEGYIKSAEKLGIVPSYEEEDESKVFVQVVYKGETSENYVSKSGICILLSPKLLESMDFVYNSSWVGKKYSYSIPKEKYLRLVKKTNPRHIHELSDGGRNEAIFDKKIPIKNYIIGVRINILFDNKYELRPDIAERCDFITYFKFFKGRLGVTDKIKGEMKAAFLLLKKTVEKIREHTNDVKYKYIPHRYEYFYPNGGKINCNKYYES